MIILEKKNYRQGEIMTDVVGSFCSGIEWKRQGDF